MRSPDERDTLVAAQDVALFMSYLLDCGQGRRALHFQVFKQRNECAAALNRVAAFLCGVIGAAVQPVRDCRFRPCDGFSSQLHGPWKKSLAHQVVDGAAAQAGDLFNVAAAIVLLSHLGIPLHASVHAGIVQHSYRQVVGFI